MTKIIECNECGMDFFGTAGRSNQPLCGRCEENENLKVLNKELISLNLWSARRLHLMQSKFVYGELEKITGEKYERP